MAESNPDSNAIEAFVKKLNEWGQSLNEDEQSLLQFLLASASETNDNEDNELSTDSLSAVAGGARRNRRSFNLSKSSKRNFLPKLGLGDVTGGGPDFWAQWAERTGDK